MAARRAPLSAALASCEKATPRCAAATTQLGTFSLAWVDLEAGAVLPVHPVRDSGTDFGFDVSPRGDVIAYVNGDDGLRLVDDRQVIREYPLSANQGTTLQSVRFAANGRSLLVGGINFAGARFAVLRADLEGHAQLALGSPSDWFAAPDESPDGRSIVWYDRELRDELWVLEPRRP